MNPYAVIETYVRDVASHLPRKQRNDVAYELHSLLMEEMQGRAAEAGRDADSAMALKLLEAFGHPADVADRYRPAGFTVIRPADAPRFALVGLGGVALQWVLSLVATYTAPVDQAVEGSDWLSRLGGWWLTWGLGSFWWPGFLITFSLLAGAIGARRGESSRWDASHAGALDRDRVKRPMLVLMLALGVIGASIVTALPMLASWASGLPQPLLTAFEFDVDFVLWRAPWVLLLWTASFALGIALLVAGRWDRRTRRLAMALDLAWIALLVWWVAAGPIFTADPTDGTAKFCLLILTVWLFVDVVGTLRRGVAPIHPPTM